MKKTILGLLTLTSLSMLIVPAKADEVNMQNVQQMSTQEGDYNRTYQESNQTVRSSRNRERGNDSPSYGNVQDIYQDSYQRGTRNSARQSNIQEIEMRTRYRR